MRQKYFFSFFLFILFWTSLSFSQTVVDDFTDGNFTSNQTWSGSTTEFSIITDATLPNGSASTDGSYLASNASQGDVSLAFASTEVSEWRFSLGSPDFNPSSSNYIGVVLMASATFSGEMVTNTFQGYYIRIGTSGSDDPISLYRKTGSGTSKVGDFPSSPSFGTGALQNGLNIRITRNSSGVFELFYSIGFQNSSTPITSAGTLTNNTYTTSSYFGVYQHIGSTSADRRVYIDNIELGVVTWDGSSSNDWSTAANWDTTTIPTSTDNVYIPSGLTNYPTASGAVTVNSTTISSGATLIAQDDFTTTVNYSRSLGTTNWYLLSSPVSGEIMTDMRANNSFADGSGGSRIGFAPYDNSQTTAAARWAYFTTSSTDALVDGKGYSTKLSATGDVSFTGTINTDAVAITLEQGAGGGGNDFNLLGNPFTAFINSNTFLTNEVSDLTEQTIWVWNQSTTSYDAKNLASGFKVAPGQGFFVEANTTNSVSFTEAMQSHESSDTFQKSNSFTIKLNLSDGTNYKYSEFYYLGSASTGLDNGFDSELFSGVSNPFAIYSHLVSNSAGKNYQIQSLPDSNYENMIVPLGINATSGKELTFSLNTLNLPSGYKVFLEDKNNGSHTRLDETNAEYKTVLTSDSNGIGRFYLHTRTSVLSTNEVLLNNVSVYTLNNNTLRISGLQIGDASVSIIDILGKRVLINAFKANLVNDINLPILKTGIYFVQLTTKEGKISKKIIIE